MKGINVSILCLGFVICASSCNGGATRQQAAENYPLLILQPEDRQLSVKYSAVVEGRQDVEVRPQVSGTITQVCVDEGAHVRKGQVLFVINPVPYRAAVAAAKAAVATAEAAEATAKQTLDGKQILFDDNIISDFELRTAQNSHNQAVAALQQAKAELVNAENNLSYTEVKSPVDGYAGMTDYRIGALVSSAMTDALITVLDNSKMYVYFSLSERQVLSLTAQYGSLDKVLASFPDVRLELNDGTTYEHTGRIDVISGIIDKATGSVRLRATFDNPGRRLMSGGQANIVIPYDRRQSIVIPQGATYEIQNRVFAYKIVNGRTASTPITVFGVDDGKEYIVEEGLAAGGTIVAEGAGLLRSGIAVAPAPAAPANGEEE